VDIKELEFSNKKLRTARHPWEYARFEVITKLISQYKHIRGIPIKVLDIGCGDAFILKLLSQRFPSGTFIGVDNKLTDDAINILEKRISNVNLFFFKSLEDYKNNYDGKIDLLLALDIIEHIKNDKAFIKNLNRVIKYSLNSILVFTVPAFPRLFSYHDAWLSHYRRYTKKSFKGLLEKSGLEVIDIGYFFSVLLLPRIILLIKEKILSGFTLRYKGISDWNKPSIITKICILILVVDFVISSFFKKLWISIPGLSCYAICKVKQ
jgi:SAM-dependent methyltransferase|tara:strand:- start:1209 stop:2003 length:795 start_codon:yes stop_codon:yes gene_type:complete